MEYIVIFISYLLGSIPFAKLIVENLTGKNVLTEGSGNPGAMNSYDITGKKYIGFLVFFFDALKGLLAVAIIKEFIGIDTYLISIGAVFVILGHNFSIFLGFKGGRGIATAFGALILINPFGMILWIFAWVLSFNVFNKDQQIANVIACILSPIMLYYTPDLAVKSLEIIEFATTLEYFQLFTMCSIVIFIKHIEPLKKKFSKKN